MWRAITKLLIVLGSVGFWRVPCAMGADASSAPSAKTPPVFDWVGWYFGGQYGYATGYSRWSANQPGSAGPVLTGSLDLTNPLSGYFGDGSYFGGLQAGYHQRIGKRLVLGAEADIWFPSFTTGLMGAQTFASPSGQANYRDIVAYSGTVRGRLGYVLDNNWLLYGTGGFAFAYDKLQRMQLAGTPGR